MLRPWGHGGRLASDQPDDSASEQLHLYNFDSLHGVRKHRPAARKMEVLCIQSVYDLATLLQSPDRCTIRILKKGYELGFWDA